MEEATEMSRKEKRKAMKKLKRKEMRKEIASKEREEGEAKLNDPVEQERLRAIEEEEARIREKEIKEFEESERVWKEAMEIKKKKEEEEEKRWKDLEELRKLEASGNDEEEDDDEYIEEGPLELIFEGDVVTLKRNKLKVPKKSVALEIVDRPTSNPLPPVGTEAYQNAQQILDTVAQEVPNFGTEQDKAHCPFHLKTGACRFGPRCSRVHFYPDKSCTILMKNMYNGPGIAWEQDEGLEVCKRWHLVMLIDGFPSVVVHDYNLRQYTDEEAELCYKEFYEDVHTEFQKYGELINFKVCRNGSFHLKGNVYVHYRSLESAILAYQSINARYFAGKQVQCEFVNISRWKVAICGEYMKSRLRTCSRGSACNFIHCFRNPGGDYEWADHDRPPPRFWIHKMTALFGYSDEYLKEMELGTPSDLRSEDSHSQHSRRSRSRDHDREIGYKPSYKNHDDMWESTRGRKLNRRQEENRHDGNESTSSTRDSSLERERRYAKKTSRNESKWSEHSPRHRGLNKSYYGRSSDGDSPDGDDYVISEKGHKRKASEVTDSELGEQIGDGKDRRTHRNSRKYSRERSLVDQEESHEHDTVRSVRDKSQRERSRDGHERSSSRYSHEVDSTETRHRPHRGSDLRDDDMKRSIESSPKDSQSHKDRDKSRERHRYKSRDPDSDRSRKEKRHRRNSGNGESLNGNGKRENGSGSSSTEESSDKEEKPHRHKKRRSQQSHDQKSPKESEVDKGETERWRPM